MIAIVLVGAWAIKGAGEPAGALGEYAAGAEGDIWALEASSVSMSDIAAANVPAVIRLRVRQLRPLQGDGARP